MVEPCDDREHGFDADLDEARAALAATVSYRLHAVTASEIADALADLRWLISTFEDHEEPQRLVLRTVADLLLGEVELRHAAVEVELRRIIEAAGGH